MKVGFIGLGRMGAPMTRNLLAAGFDTLVYNRSPAKVRELVVAGARGADSVAALTEAADVVLACLPSVAATEEVFLGEVGVVAHARADQILVDHSTIGPRTARRIAEAATGRGAAFLDAPISGGVPGAEDGTLSIMAGGTVEAFARVLPVFRAMGRTVEHVGGVGAGSTVKLVNQLLTAIHSAAAAEAMVLGVKAGAEPRQLFEILRVSFGQSRMLERLVPRFLDRDFDGASAMRLLLKDLRLIGELAHGLSVSTPLLDTAAEMFGAAARAGFDQDDVASVILTLEKDAGVRVGGRGE